MLKINKYLENSNSVLLAVLGISVFSLIAALTAEVAFGLEPCPLCLYQRIPFLMAAILAIIGLITRKNNGLKIVLTALCAVLFLANTGIAFYHTGVELHWWRSAIEGCLVPSFTTQDQSLLENILSAPSARCDEIPWADPILGLSMANYNVLLCLALFAGCALSALKQHQAYSK